MANTKFISRFESAGAVDESTVGSGTVSLDTSVTRLSGTRCIKCDAGASNQTACTLGGGVGVNSRFTMDFMLPALPVADSTIIGVTDAGGTQLVFLLQVTSGGLLKVLAGNSRTVVGTGATAVVANQWFRVCMTWTITSTTVWSLKVFLSIGPSNYNNSTTEINTSNGATLGTATPVLNFKGWVETGQAGASKLVYYQNVYIDDGSTLTDIGDMRVTAKLPTTRTSTGFTTTVGTGAVNERPISSTNGRRAPSSAGTVTEGYSIEAQSAGDLDLTLAIYKIVAYSGIVFGLYIEGGASPVTNIVLNGASTAITLTLTIAGYPVTVDTSVYPVTSPVIGMSHSGTGDLSELDDCGLVFAYLVGDYTVTDSVKVQESEVTSLQVRVNPSETAKVQEAEVTTILVSVNPSESAAVQASEVGLVTALLSAVDSLGLTAVEALAILVRADVADLTVLGASESVTLLGSLNVSEATALTLLEAVAVLVSVGPADAAAVQASEASSVSVVASASDSAAVVVASETTGVAVFVAPSDAAAVQAGEAVALLVRVDVAEAAAVQASEFASILASLNVTELVVVVAVEAASIVVNISAADQAAVQEADATTVLGSANATEGVVVGASESPALQVSVGPADVAALQVGEVASVVVTVTGLAELLGITVAEATSIVVAATARDGVAVLVGEVATIVATGDLPVVKVVYGTVDGLPWRTDRVFRPASFKVFKKGRW